MWLNVVILALRTVMFYGGQCPAGGGFEKVEKKQKKTVLSFSVNATKRPTGVRKKRKTSGEGATALYFWRHSLGNS